MRRLIGIVLLLAAVLGLIFSLTGIAAVWVVKQRVTAYLVSTFDLIDSTLDATTAGLIVVDQTLTSTSEDITVIENTINTASKSINDTVPLLDSFTILMREDLPVSIRSTQTALSSAQAAAESIEGFLVLLGSIPLLPLGTYEPEVPLTVALGEVSSSLDPIPGSFTDMADNLQISQDNLTLISSQVDIMSENVGGLKTSLSRSQTVLVQYQGVLGSLQARVNSIKASLPGVITATAWALTILFVWLGITQIGLLTQGLERLQTERTLSISSETQED